MSDEIPDDPAFEEWAVRMAVADGVLASPTARGARQLRKAAREGRKWARRRHGAGQFPASYYHSSLDDFRASAEPEVEQIVGSAFGLIAGFLLRQLLTWAVKRIVFWAWCRASAMYRPDPSVLIAPPG